MKILIDNGHGVETPGKRSPDGILREYKYAREIADGIVAELTRRGYDASRIVTEEEDIPLSVRARRVNDICLSEGKDNVLLVSVHCNAAGNGREWMFAKGWSAYTTKGTTRSDDLADRLYEAAAEVFKGKKLRIRKDLTDGDPDWEENFYILRKTSCAAVLTENFFQDNKEDVAYLLSKEGRADIIKVHVDGIIKFIESNA